MHLKVRRTNSRRAAVREELTDTWHMFVLLAEWPSALTRLIFLPFSSPSWSLHLSSLPLPFSPSFFHHRTSVHSHRLRSRPQTHTHAREKRGLYCSCLLCRIQHKTTVSPKDPHTADMKWCTKIKEENAVKKEGRRKRRRRAVVGTALAPVALSNCSLLSSSLFKKKKNTKHQTAAEFRDCS